MTEDILDYADLVRRYEAGLIENLRSFGFQSEYLELWVPDEDLTRSLLNLFDAAAEVGHRSLAVRIPSESLTTIEAAGLPALAAQRGAFSVENAGSTAVLRIDGLRLATDAKQTQAPQPVAGPAANVAAIAEPTAEAVLRQPQSIAAPYTRHLAAVTGAIASSIPPGAVTCRAEIDGLALQVEIDPKDHTIRGMAAQGATGEVTRHLLAALADLCQGLPILEAADHGAIKLEFQLRDEGARPRAGIVIAECTDPAFHFVSALLRAILADYRHQTGFKATANTFDVPPGPRWMQADEAGRRALLNEAFASAGLPAEVAIVVAIEYDVRIVVALGGTPPDQTARTLTKLERIVKQRVDPRLELFLSEVKDSNKLRRLSEQQSKAS